MNKKIFIMIGIMVVAIIFPIFKTIKSHHIDNNVDISFKNRTTAFKNTSVTYNKTINKLDEDFHQQENTYTNKKENLLSSTEDINLLDLDGKGKNYSFTYKNDSYSAIYSKDNWHIIDSYKIKNSEDITIICQALINVHPIHGNDMISYRTSKDMTYEWLQHNLAYNLLPDDSPWKEHAKNVDLNPTDQGKNIVDMYKSRISK